MRGRRDRLVLVAFVVFVAVVVLIVSQRDAQASGQRVRSCPDAVRGLSFYRARAAHWKARAGAPFPRRFPAANPQRVCAHTRRAAEVWRTRSRRARREAEQLFDVLYSRFRCVHEHEGSWIANTGNGYQGGLQMDASFQAAYGSEYVDRWGGAHRWPVWAQLIAAERARRVRGWTPWPNTARTCGLL